MIASIGLHSLWVRLHVHVVKKWCRFVRIYVFSSILPHWSQILLLCNHLNVIHIYRQKWALFTMNEHTFPVRNSPSQVEIKLARTVFPMAIRQMDDRTNFVQEVPPQDLQLSPMIWAICVVENVSQHLDILISVFVALLKHPPILPGCKQILHQLHVHHKLVILQ